MLSDDMGILKKKMETAVLHWGHMGNMEYGNYYSTLGLYGDNGKWKLL